MIDLVRMLAANSRRAEGQTMAEYAVVLAVITIAVVATLGLLSTAIKGKLTSVIGVL
jgi:Flp pilus assembly pilin Flp